MKLTKFTHLVVLGLILTVAAAGCKKGPGYVTKIPRGQTENPNDINSGRPLGDIPGATDVTSGGGIPSNPPGGREGWIPKPGILEADTVYFGFDSSVVKADEKSKVSAVADYMKANAADAVKIEGHCDERGTEEYNRSLGERRALALREELVRLGVDPTRVDTLSFGKDRPKESGHDELAWRKNRRGEFIVLSPPVQ